MAARRTHVGRKAKRGEILRQMLGRGLAIAGERRIGRDRLDPQKREQSFEAVVDIGVDMREHGVEVSGLGIPISEGLSPTALIP